MVDSWPPSLDNSDVERGWLKLDGTNALLQLLNERAAFVDQLGSVVGDLATNWRLWAQVTITR
jgi:hypothetical protein